MGVRSGVKPHRETLVVRELQLQRGSSETFGTNLVEGRKERIVEEQ